MKINFWIPHTRVSGGIIVILYYAAALSARGHDVTLVVASPHWLRRQVANMVRYVPSWMKTFGSFKINRVKNFAHVSAYNGAHVVIADSWKVASYITHVPDSIRKIHVIQHDERLYHGDRTDVDAVYKLPVQKIVVSSWIQDMIKKDYGHDSRLLLNTVDTQIFKNRARTHADDTIKILVLDHSYPWKGTREAIDIVRALQKEIHKKIVLVGFGARREHATHLYDEYYYNVHHVDMARIYAQCDIYLCASWDEGFGLPSLEAMACGTALVTYDNGGSRDFAFHEKTALVAPRRDQGELKKQLQRIIEDDRLRSDIVRNGLHFVETLPTWQHQADKLIDILKSERKVVA